MKVAKMKKPKKLATADFVYGVSVRGKDEIEVSYERMGLFKQMGFRVIKVYEKKEKDEKADA